MNLGSHPIRKITAIAAIASLSLLTSSCRSCRNGGNQERAQGEAQDKTQGAIPQAAKGDTQATSKNLTLPEGSTLPSGSGQLTSPATWFTAGNDELGHQIEYNGQASKQGKIILTASNGYFDHGLIAKGKSTLQDVANGSQKNQKKGHSPLIAHDYAYLDRWTQPGQTMRWHLYFAKDGLVKFLIHLKPNPTNPDGTIIISFDGQKKQIKTHDAKALKEGLVFRVRTPGKHTLKLTAETTGGKPLGQLSTIDVYGPAIGDAQLLRARWRPIAVHGSYRSSQMKDTTMWVMVSKSLGHTSSYSPIVTPFGYYGGSFDADQRFSGGFNFSMWSDADAPLEQQAHLLVLGSPQLEFSGFGHEGTGVKPRGWSPLAESKPKEVVQCLRVERGKNYNTYYGYFIDPKTQSWKLFSVGRKWIMKKKGNLRKKKSSLWPGSFVEVPGPPQVQRSGDLERRVVRKGWCIDAEGKWQRLDILPAGKTHHNNKSWGITKDGWFLFKMGGMEHFTGAAKDIQLDTKFLSEPLPDFLSPEKVEQLYDLPVQFGKQTTEPQRTSAAIHLNMKDAGTNARAVVYFGERDSVTFVPRKISGTEKKNSTFKNEYVWKHAQKVTSLITGDNTVKLQGLKPNTTYYFRSIVHNDEGTMWDFESHSFTTKR